MFPKSDEEKQRLKSFISESILFSHLGPEELEEVSDSFFPVTHEPGAFIIKQGDDGDNYYIIDSGRCEIYVRPAALTTGAGNKVAEITKGGSFGELALMYNAPRAATVIVGSFPSLSCFFDSFFLNALCRPKHRRLCGPWIGGPSTTSCATAVNQSDKPTSNFWRTWIF